MCVAEPPDKDLVAGLGMQKTRIGLTFSLPPWPGEPTRAGNWRILANDRGACTGRLPSRGWPLQLFFAPTGKFLCQLHGKMPDLKMPDLSKAQIRARPESADFRKVKA